MQTMLEIAKPIIWVEGLLASGKTTFCRQMAKRLKFKFLEEPVGGNFLLTDFYKDQKTHAFAMQILLLHLRYAMKQEASFQAIRLANYAPEEGEAASEANCNGILVDRSIAGDRVFALVHRDAGNIHPKHWDVYQYAFQVMARTIQPPILFLYLDVQPETAYERMKARERKAEVDVKLDYLVKLREGYEKLIKELRTGMAPWAHSVQVERIIWDRDTLSEDEWRNVARTVSDACRR
jgi:deoxyadenosine/deoxycytidine kinase